MLGIFDSHAHYDDSRFDEDREELLTKMAEAAAVAGESVEEMEVEKIIDGEMEQNEFYETRELNACAEQIDLEIVYNI